MFQILDVFLNVNDVRNKKEVHIQSGLIASVDYNTCVVHD